MKQIKTFVQKNQMTMAVVVIIMAFGSWMYSAHKNMQEREARIEQVIANGGTHYPSEQLTVDMSYMAGADCVRNY